MCICKRYVLNRYTGKYIFVKCGKCKACLTEKMQHQRTLMVNESTGVALFVTLTYNEESVPFVLGRHCFTDSFEVFRDGVKIDDLPHEDFEGESVPYSFNILYYDDFQKFIKRLSAACKRHFISLPKYSYAGEYGASKTSNLRPHFHVLFFFKDFSNIQLFEDLCISCWKFCSWDKLPREECFKLIPNKSVSGYISTYLTMSSMLPDYLEIYQISQKVRHSKQIGRNVPEFDLLSFWNNACLGRVQFTSSQIKSDKVLPTFLYPKYIIDTYFPKFKGFSRLNSYEVLCVVEPFLTNSFLPDWFIERCDYNEDDIYYFRLFCRKYIKYSQELGVPLFVYLDVMCRFYDTLYSFLIKSVHQDIYGIPLPVSHLQFCYDNLMLNKNCLKNEVVINPNFYPDNVRRHNKLMDYYNRQKHNHKVKSFLNKNSNGY